jgi:uncharacterized Zn finger protein (UPF0148 family)
MNVVCPACERLVPLGAFRVDAGRLYVTCSKCGTESAAEGAPAASPTESPAQPPDAADPFAVPPNRCPKCIALKPSQATACPSCGLSFEGASADAYAPSAELAAQWKDLLTHWAEPEAHEKLVSSSALQGDLASLGRLYRLRLALAPADAIAQQGRDAVLARASAPSAFPVSAKAPKAAQTWRVVALGVAALGLLVIVFRLIRLLFAMRA